MNFPIRLDPLWRLPLLTIGATPRLCYVQLEPDLLGFHFGAYVRHFTLGEIEGVEHCPWRLLYGIGIRLAPKRTLGLVGSTQGVVVVRLRQPQTLWLPFPWKFQRIAVSLEDPDAFVKALGHRLAARG